MIKVDKKQQKLLEDFFQEETTWHAEYVGINVVAYFLMGISMMLWILPYQIWEGDYGVSVLWSMYGLELLGMAYYIQKFNTYKEENRMKMLYDVLKYLPVSYGQLCIFRLKKLKKVCTWLVGITISCQTIFAIAFMHTFSIGNILIPFFGNFVLPLALWSLSFIKCGER